MAIKEIHCLSQKIKLKYVIPFRPFASLVNCRMGLFGIKRGIHVSQRQMGLLKKIRGPFRMARGNGTREPGLVAYIHYLCILRSVCSSNPSQTGASRSGKSKEAKPSKETVRTKKSKDTDRTDVSKKTKNAASRLKALAKPQPVTLFLGLEDMKEISAEEVPDLAPCWGHFIYVSQSRDVPLDPKNVRSIY